MVNQDIDYQRHRFDLTLLVSSLCRCIAASFLACIRFCFASRLICMSHHKAMQSKLIIATLQFCTNQLSIAIKLQAQITVAKLKR
jgi:hypothetical protein